MKPDYRRFKQLAPDDVTLDAPAELLSASTPPPVAPCKVELVEGSESGLTNQTHSLLRTRLRAASLVLFLGSGAFLVKNLVIGGYPNLRDPVLIEGQRLLLYFHVFHVAMLGLVSVVLLGRCQQLSLRQLRLAELAIFAWTALFFLRVQHFNSLYCATQYGFIPNPAGMWFMLIFTYAIFIPNTWRRAAGVVGVMAAAPVVWSLFDMTWFDAIARCRDNYDEFPTLVLLMATGFGAGVFGTHMIGNLRREAYEAKQLGQYRLKRRIGAGGMGEVYLAEHQLLKRPCALKVIRPGKADDPKVLARFEREVRATAALSHWNTVEIYDYGRTDEGTFYYVMEYLPGKSLADLVAEYGPLPAGRVIYLLRQTCDALHEAHSAGLIHRDIKPGNIFAAQRGGVYDVAKLLDFGLAKPRYNGNGENIQLTHDGAITGSPLYMSPEQSLGENEPDARGDIYSLGAVGYFLLTGHPPFEADTAMKVLVAHAREEPSPVSRWRHDVPGDLERVVLRCLAKRPEERFQDVLALHQAFADCEAAGDWSPERAEKWWYETEHMMAEAAG
ncbi:MAG TPA: serine/threonine-protein kinase [Pirellulales bacterium]|jgi:serine/threonine-protein kinase|nr:serine/threonine-protein kinase [Pirellulales bacterium]